VPPKAFNPSLKPEIKKILKTPIFSAAKGGAVRTTD